MSNKQPDFNVYSLTFPDSLRVAAGNDKKEPYIKIGVAWSHGKGGGLAIKLNAQPLGNSITLFPVKEQSGNSEESGNDAPG